LGRCARVQYHVLQAFFKIPIGLFDSIVEDVTEHDNYFTQKEDACCKLGFTPIQKIRSAVRLLTSGVVANEHNDKYCMAATTGIKYMKRFCDAMVEVYDKVVLRHPNFVDMGCLLMMDVPRDFWVALVRLIVCTGGGNIIPQLGEECSKASPVLLPLCWRQLLIIVVVSGTSTSALPVV
jgi:hypothetical protein